MEIRLPNPDKPEKRFHFDSCACGRGELTHHRALRGTARRSPLPFREGIKSVSQTFCHFAKIFSHKWPTTVYPVLSR